MIRDWLKRLDRFGYCDCDGRSEVETVEIHYGDPLTGHVDREDVPVCSRCDGFSSAA